MSRLTRTTGAPASSVSPYGLGGIGQGPAVVEDGRFDAGFVRDFGVKLFEALFSGRVGEVLPPGNCRWAALQVSMIADYPGWLASLGNCSTTPAGVRSLPWRTPWCEVSPCSAHPTTESRSAAAGSCQRCLGFPRGVAQLAGQVEVDGIEDSLAGLMRRGQVEVGPSSPPPGRTSESPKRAAGARAPFHRAWAAAIGSTAPCFSSKTREAEQIRLTRRHWQLS